MYLPWQFAFITHRRRRCNSPLAAPEMQLTFICSNKCERVSAWSGTIPEKLSPNRIWNKLAIFSPLFSSKKKSCTHASIHQIHISNWMSCRRIKLHKYPSRMLYYKASCRETSSWMIKVSNASDDSLHKGERWEGLRDEDCKNSLWRQKIIFMLSD